MNRHSRTLSAVSAILLVGAACACGPTAAPPARLAAGAICPPPGGVPDLTGALTFDSTEVDRDATVIGVDTTVTLPAVDGRAVARFVIDASGRADLRTLSIETGGDDDYGTLARLIVPHTRFEAAVLRGCRVRVWARWPFASTGRPARRA